MQYQDHLLAKRYVELVRSVYKRDAAAQRVRRHARPPSGTWRR